MVFGLALRDTISGTRLIEQVPVFPTRSRPTKRTLGWQQFDVKDAEIALLTAPWLNAPTEKKDTIIDAVPRFCHIISVCYEIIIISLFFFLLSLSLSFIYFFLVKDPKHVDNKTIAMAALAPGIQLWIN